MKLQILLLFYVLLFCACETSQKAQSNQISYEANFNQPTNVNAIENRQVEIEKPKLVDDSRFSPVKIKRADQGSKFSLNIDVEYPQLKKAKTPQEIKFNQYVKKQVDAQLLDFSGYLVDRHKERKSKGEYEINLNYDVEYFSANFASVLMNWNGYSGYLNMNYFPSTINFDLKEGKAVELKELFESDTKYLEKISELSIEKLKRTCLMCPCKDGTNAGKPLPEGVSDNGNVTDGMFNLNEVVSAKEENFGNWSITTEGFKITFNEYQVGPGCIGIIDIVIPFADLQPILRKDLNFN